MFVNAPRCILFVSRHSSSLIIILLLIWVLGNHQLNDAEGEGRTLGLSVVIYLRQ